MNFDMIVSIVLPNINDVLWGDPTTPYIPPQLPKTLHNLVLQHTRMEKALASKYSKCILKTQTYFSNTYRTKLLECVVQMTLKQKQ
jgi:hypothetical protein